MQLNLRHSKSISNYIIAGSIYNKGSNICIYALTVENSQDLLLEDEFFKPSARKWITPMIFDSRNTDRKISIEKCNT
ncbi:hypothetical protein T09_5786 [Trichinella sp. T9]|nr:hypothetical protein T09_5786 [Trichinella sp. T9]